MKNLSKLFVVLVLVFLGVNTAKAQRSLKDDEAKKAAEVKDLITDGRYTFEATKMISQKGNSSALASGYDLDVSKDTVIASLPLNAHAAEINSGEKGIQFTCTRFDYNVSAGKNGHQEITIMPKENNSGMMKEIRKLKLDISALGYTTLTVTRSGSPVSYYGYIKGHSAEFPQVSAQQ
jgi:hypothetical protein